MKISRGPLTRSAGALAAVSFVMVACGGRAATPASPKLTQACESFCARYANCPAHPDGEACRTRCTTRDSVRRVEAMRAEASDAWWSCFSANACEADLGAAGERCVRAVATKLPPTAKAKAMCAKLEPPMNDCGVTWNMPCTAELSVFEESDLSVFEECASRSCKRIGTCFSESERELLARRH